MSCRNTDHARMHAHAQCDCLENWHRCISRSLFLLWIRAAAATIPFIKLWFLWARGISSLISLSAQECRHNKIMFRVRCPRIFRNDFWLHWKPISSFWHVRSQAEKGFDWSVCDNLYRSLFSLFHDHSQIHSISLFLVLHIDLTDTVF